MAKAKSTKSTAAESFFADLAQETGGELLSDMIGATYFIDTGNLALNRACSGKYLSGGIPGGRIIEILGPESSAKSYFGTNCLFGTQKVNGIASILDVENAANPEWIERSSHINIKKVLRYTPQSLERCFNKIYGLIRAVRARDKKVPITIVYDSLSVSPSEREHQEMLLPENATAAQRKEAGVGKEQPGERARICSRELRKLNGLLEQENATVFIINQMRQKIGVMYGDDRTAAGGGNSLKYYASLRLMTGTAKKIENKKLGTVVGVKLTLTAFKNRFFKPHSKAEDIELLFEHGVNPLSGLLKALIQDERVIMGSAGNYTVAPTYLPEGMEKRSFKASLESNKVPIEVLLDCPKLVDGANKEEIIAYLEPYKGFEVAIANPDLVEVSVSEEEQVEGMLESFFNKGNDNEEEAPSEEDL